MRRALGPCFHACRSPKTEVTFGRHALGAMDSAATAGRSVNLVGAGRQDRYPAPHRRAPWPGF
ncbi:hypothetical protein FJ977_06870 [Mesorhizobium sp. B2-1-3A]|nr:hypothetical protein FJ977_06870 [Mesorhizobium sp. B2-1-3A]